jgi:hypothetical protein
MENPERTLHPGSRPLRGPNWLKTMRLRSPSRTREPRRGRFGVPAAFLSLFLGLAVEPAAEVSPPETPSGNRTDYVIHATLEGEVEGPKLLHGRLTAKWTNGSEEEVGDLWFHLYLNAFSNNRSTHLQEEGGRIRGVEIEDGWGWSQVTGIGVREFGDRESRDVLDTLTYQRPDDGRADDRTVFSVTLPRPIRPGETIEVELEWESRLPQLRRRTGAKEDFLLVAQWFPKLGVYETGRGWNCHQFHRHTEFYADFGTYDVTLTLPSRFAGKVGATGFKMNEVRKGDTVELTFAAPSRKDRLGPDRTGKRPLVHDFAWTADPRFVVESQTFRFERWAENFPSEVERVRRALGEEVDLTLRDVDVTILIHPERADQVGRIRKATFAALFFYGLWFGEYPFEHVTVVDPAWGARGAGGMEYPTLFTAGSPLFATKEMQQPEGVVIHECGHQFFQGLVGNNEFEAAFLDEGINSYADSEVRYAVFGERQHATFFSRIPFDGTSVGGDAVASEYGTSTSGAVRDMLRSTRYPIPVLPDLRPIRNSGFLDLWRAQPQLTFVRELSDPRWEDRSGYLANPDAGPVDFPSWRYIDRRDYRANSYDRTAVALRTLRSVVGEDEFLRGMRHFSTTWRYRHPYPEDFYAAFEEGAGADVGWYFREIFQGVARVDWRVEVEQRRRSPEKGFFQGESGRFLELSEELPVAAEGPRIEPWILRITLHQSGELRLDLPVQLTFEDGSTEDLTWTRAEQGEMPWKLIERESDLRLKSVVLDPHHGIYLDGDMSNNQWYDETDELAPWRWGERVLARLQRSLHWIGGIGG